MTNVIMFNDSSNKALYLLDYLVEQGYNPKVIDVNVASTLEEQLDKVTNDGTKVFLHYTYEDLKEDKEKLRQEIQGLESKGWRNLIVLPFEGMNDDVIELRVQDLGLKFVSDKVDVKVQGGIEKPYVEVPGTKQFHVGKDDVRQIIDTAPDKVAVSDFDTSIDLSKLPLDKNSEKVDTNKKKRKVR
jgi:hypothetical protein